MAINFEEARRLFPDGIIKKLDCCNFCPYEEILRPNQRRIEVLYTNINDIITEKHPHRTMVEQTCGKTVDLECYIKYAAMRTPFDDFMLAEMGSVENLKNNLGLNTISEAWMEWVADRIGITPEYTNGTKHEYGNYADRFKKIWNLSDRTFNNIEQNSLNVLGMYQIVLLDQENFNKEKDMLELLRKKELERHNGHMELPEKVKTKSPKP